MMKVRSTVLLGLCLVTFAGFRAWSAEIGQAAPDFTLTNLDGEEVSLSSFAGTPVVLEWTNYHCPFVVKFYRGGHMQALQKEYMDKGVAWLVICSSAPGKQGYFTVEQWKQEAADRNTEPTAILLDTEGAVGRQYGARTTPHMYVINEDGVLVYMGAIDDKPTANPNDIEGATNYVRLAVDAVLAGEAVATPSTRPYGCSVKY